ncbi:hypothetical protein BB559_005014 [Furculomyces boomerangus]|uniref:Caffeoyl-CoA O-methyltransferase n=2 Tax=Harpellales TaxID=61421 RepID=A0A2T9YBC2_9FUNG|nr:hypothetical protein BB559_005014 [Furculomyces boomerangus]PVZ98148.1 hypothetical protein BB558_005871 [Smittium angustum]
MQTRNTSISNASTKGISAQSSSLLKAGSIIYRNIEDVHNVHEYCSKYSTQQPKHLEELYVSTSNNRRDSVMMISPLQGRTISMLVSMKQPKRVLELGCFVGYSALWMAEGLLGNKSPSHITTCEIDKELAESSRNYIEKVGRSNLISVVNKPAQEVLDSWNPEEKLDFVFIDADKGGYWNYYNTILERNLLSPDGIMIVDNTLFYGKVHALEEPMGDKGKSRSIRGVEKYIYNFNKMVSEDKRTEKVILPIFDGLTLIKLAK